MSTKLYGMHKLERSYLVVDCENIHDPYAVAVKKSQPQKTNMPTGPHH